MNTDSTSTDKTSTDSSQIYVHTLQTVRNSWIRILMKRVPIQLVLIKRVPIAYFTNSTQFLESHTDAASTDKTSTDNIQIYYVLYK
jgi:hypothetical protein